APVPLTSAPARGRVRPATRRTPGPTVLVRRSQASVFYRAASARSGLRIRGTGVADHPRPAVEPRCPGDALGLQLLGDPRAQVDLLDLRAGHRPLGDEPHVPR